MQKVSSPFWRDRMYGHCRRLPRFLAASLFCLALAAAARAADWPVPRGPSHEPAPYRYDAAQWKKVPRDFLDDAPACTLYSGTTYLVEPDGTTETIVHDITRFNSRKGIDKLGEYRNISYDPTYQKLTLNEALIHKADGRDLPIDPRSAQLRDLSTDYQVYDHEKQLILSLPNLEVGDTIEIKWSVRGRNPEYQGHFFTRYTFGDDQYPVVRDELRIRLPKDRPLKHATVNGKLAPDIKDEGDARVFVWSAVNTRQLPQDDNLPSKEELRLQVACSTLGSWEEVGRWKQNLRADCWECTAEVRQLTRDLTRDLKTPAEKARVLAYWVRRNVRYVSLGEKHDYTPQPPAYVLNNRAGDCKDQSQLLAVMLREAGIPVALATLGTLDDGQVLEAVPSPWGTHAILLVTIDGKEHWVDSTASLAGWDFLPREDHNRLCYVVDYKGNLRLVRTPPLTADDNRIEQTTHVSVGADGSSHSERTLSYSGSAALVQRDTWVDVPPGERRRLMAAELQDANSKSRLVRLEVDEQQLREFDGVVRARVAFDTPGHFSSETDPEGSLADSKVWGKLLAFNVDYDRTSAFDLAAPFESRHHFVLTLPPAYHLDSVPRDRFLRSRWGTFRLIVRADSSAPRRAEIDMVTRLERVRVEPADFEEFHKFHEEVSKYYRVWFTLKAAQDLDEAPALEAVLATAPEDTASAMALARLYQQHVMKKEAQRVLKRALHYRPTDQALLELTVKVADTSAQEEAAWRELVQRFPDEPKYAVALGTALVESNRSTDAQKVLEPLTKSAVSAIRAQAYYQLARNHFKHEEPAKALSAFESASKADSETTGTVTALTFRGQVHEKLGRTKDAIADYEQAVHVDADAEGALLALVRLHWEARERTEALDALRRYTVAASAYPDGLVTAAEWHLKLGRYDDALDLAQQAREAKPEERAQRVLGLVHLHRGEYEDAVRRLEKAEPNAEVLTGLIRAHLALGDLREAVLRARQAEKVKAPSAELSQLCKRVAALEERSAMLLKAAGADRARQGLPWAKVVGNFVCAEEAHRTSQPLERVEVLLRGAIQEDAMLGPSYALRGQLALEKGRLTRALADAEQAIRLAPQDPSGYYVRGRVRLERASEDALADLEKAATLGERKDGGVLHWLAAALAQAGRAREALNVQREAVRSSPDNQEFREQLQELEKGPSGAAPKTGRSGS
jgi:tetratricopeptide (TPR) repeat protein/transglutaminase-like putative cysteine protease